MRTITFTKILKIFPQDTKESLRSYKELTFYQKNTTFVDFSLLICSILSIMLIISINL
jgi:hypothetical protein